MRTLVITAQGAGVGQQMAVAAPQPRDLAPPQPHPRVQQHDQPVPGTAAREEHRHEFLVQGPVDLRLWHLQPVPCPKA
ncbi:hypothetical protein ACIBAH_32665 [Streptomyces sp. NPDC051445]|uniref:hypothetical protein n=1 Tax=Streptomyces sp. NPDC051445 TaxID=3365653 RepID=UPI0037BBA160